MNMSNQAAHDRKLGKLHDGLDVSTFDRDHLWHPYSTMVERVPMLEVASAQGVRLQLEDGTELIDAMSSWWCAIHGYNHPHLNQALNHQIDQMSHVMFGGLTHRPAVKLGQQLLDVAPNELETVFFADSGSVSVEVAIKMAIQYWASQGRGSKNRLLTVRSGYHGDTTGAMSVCDPLTGMHHLFTNILPQHMFVEAPRCRFGEPCEAEDIHDFEATLREHAHEIAAVILEPIVQGAGGMRMYAAGYLSRVHELCKQHDVLLIFDEIATGFGRTGKYFACEHADVSPDIMCVGKALTGGYMTMAATMTTRQVADVLSTQGPGVFMHGPTFMANPLACAAASASLELLETNTWKTQIPQIEEILHRELNEAQSIRGVADVRVLGAIGVIELEAPVEMQAAQRIATDHGVWLRPFGKLIYTMPPYVITPEELRQVTKAMVSIANDQSKLV